MGNVFVPPQPTQSYKFESNELTSGYTMKLNNGTEWYHVHRYPDKFDAFFIQTSNGNRIACLKVKPCENPKYTILFSHGGTVDLGDLCNFFYTLALSLNCNIFSYDYSGFGESSGIHTEESIYSDAEAALQILIKKYAVKLNKIILYGQSLGTAASIYLAIKQDFRGVVLHSPFLSIERIFMPRTRINNFFTNVDNIGSVKSPILIIHGTDDFVVPISHAYELLKLCRNKVTPLWVDGGVHDDLYTYEEYLARLKKFVDLDMKQVSSL